LDLDKADKKRLEAFEVWIWRKMLKIDKTDKVTNASVLEGAKVEKNIPNTIRYRNIDGLGMFLERMFCCEISQRRE